MCYSARMYVKEVTASARSGHASAGGVLGGGTFVFGLSTEQLAWCECSQGVFFCSFYKLYLYFFFKAELLCKSILTALPGEKNNNNDNDSELRVSFLLTDFCRSIEGKLSRLKMFHCTTRLDIYSKTNRGQNHLCWCSQFCFVFFAATSKLSVTSPTLFNSGLPKMSPYQACFQTGQRARYLNVT